LHRCLDHFDVGCGEYGVEGAGELAVTVPDEEAEPGDTVTEIHQ
jgi:hypothetical protein